MLSAADKPQTVGFHYADRHSPLLRLDGIGWEKKASADYRWNGLQRGDDGTAIFQYTISGRGELRIGDRLHSLPPNRAFICVVPSDHEYYLPQGEAHWEYFFISVYGGDAVGRWLELESKLGNVFELPSKSAPLDILSMVYLDVLRSPMPDAYDIAASLYRFVAELHRHADAAGTSKSDDIPEPLLRAIAMIRLHYHEDLSLDDVAAASGLTKYHFCRLFFKKLGITPMQFLRKVRIERAVWLLNHTDRKIADIGLACGFVHATYFIKTFRETVGSTPGEYREVSDRPEFDQWKVEV